MPYTYSQNNTTLKFWKGQKIGVYEKVEEAPGWKVRFLGVVATTGRVDINQPNEFIEVAVFKSFEAEMLALHGMSEAQLLPPFTVRLNGYHVIRPMPHRVEGSFTASGEPWHFDQTMLECLASDVQFAAVQYNRVRDAVAQWNDCVNSLNGLAPDLRDAAQSLDGVLSPAFFSCDMTTCANDIEDAAMAFEEIEEEKAFDDVFGEA